MRCPGAILQPQLQSAEIATVTTTQRQGPLEHVAQLANVAWPAVTLEQLEVGAGQILGMHAAPRIKMAQQLGDILRVLAQWWNRYVNDRQTMKQVEAKTLSLHHVEQVTVGSRDHSRVDFHGLIAADRDDLLLLESPQQLGLHRHR